MGVIAISADKHYPVSEAWLKTDGVTGKPEYVDIREVIMGNGTSAYVDWVIANDSACPITIKSESLQKNRYLHAAAATMTLNGIRIGETGSGGEITGRLKNDTFTDKGKYVGGINHPERYGRIYRKGTTARHIWFVGIA